MTLKAIQLSLPISILVIRKLNSYLCNVQYFREKIIGYKNLRVTLIYSDLSMYSHLKIEHDGELISDEVKPDDICKKILDVYPEEQQV